MDDQKHDDAEPLKVTWHPDRFKRRGGYYTLDEPIVVVSPYDGARRESYVKAATEAERDRRRRLVQNG